MRDERRNRAAGWILASWTVGIVAVVFSDRPTTPVQVRAQPPTQTLAQTPQTPAPSVSAATDDPFPVRLIRVSAEQLPHALRAFPGIGPLRTLSRDEWDRQLQQFRRWQQEQRAAPVISEIRLRARLAETDLVGEAELDIQHGGSGPRLVMLEPFRLAVLEASWSDGRTAILGMPAGSSTPAVWIERPGVHTLRCNWSLAGIAAPTEKRFELRLPPATAAVLELDLPTELIPVAGGTESLITGPFPLNGPQLQRWRIRFNSRGRLEVILRAATHAPPPATAETHARYDIAPGVIHATFEFDLRPQRGSSSQWTFHVDRGIRVVDAMINNRARWTIEPPHDDQKPRLLHLHLTQPTTGGRVIITAMAPLPPAASGGEVTLPVVRPLATVPVRESVEVRLSPELRLLQCTDGEYRLRRTAQPPEGGLQLQWEGDWRVGNSSSPFRRLPTLRVRDTEPYLTIHEQQVWQIAPRVRLQVRQRIAVRSAPLFECRWRLPEGFELQNLSAVPDCLVVREDAATVRVECLQPVSDGQTLELQWELHGVLPLPKRQGFPSLTPLQPYERDGLLAIQAPPDWPFQVQHGPGTEPMSWWDWERIRLPPSTRAAYRYQTVPPNGWCCSDAAGFPPAIPAAAEPAVAPHPTPADVPVASAWQVRDTVHILTVLQGSIIRGVVAGTATADPPPATLPLHLPPQARPYAVSIGGHRLDITLLQTDPDGRWLIPWPSPTGPTRVVVHYEWIRPEPYWLPVLTFPEVRWPDDSASEQCWWQVMPPLLPLNGRWTPPPELLETLMAAGNIYNGDGYWCRADDLPHLWFGTPSQAVLTGCGLTVVVLLMSLAVPPRRAMIVGLTGTVAAIGLGLVSAPWWSRSMGVVATLLPLLTAARWIHSGCRSGGAGGTIVASVVASAVAVVPPLAAQSVPETVVFLLPPDASGQERVMVPAAAWERLTQLRPTFPPYLLTEAHYQLQADQGSSRIRARWTVYVLQEGETSLMLPLGEARLEQLTVQGQPALPQLQRAGVYAVPLPGAGRYEVAAQFVVPLSGASEREVRCGIPECPRTDVQVVLSAGVRQAYVLGRLGHSRIRSTPSPSLEAAIGQNRQLHVRWSGEPVAAAVQVREATIWDVTPQSAELTTAYLLRVERGAIAEWQWELPPELQPTHVSVRSLDGGEASVLQDWTVLPGRGGWQNLRVSLRWPVSGRWVMVFKAVPRQPLHRQPTLRFPRLLAPSLAAESIYGLRLRQAVVESLQRHGVIDFSPDALGGEFAAIPELRLDANAPSRVFRPTSDAPTELRPTLRDETEVPQFTMTTRWQIVPSQAVASGTISWSGGTIPGRLEWTLPGGTVTEIRGSEVVAWSQSGPVVQVWLRRPLASGTLRWQAAFPVPEGPFDLPTPRLRSPATVAETVSIETFQHRCTWERTQGWNLVAEQPGRWRWQSDGQALPLRIRELRP